MIGHALGSRVEVLALDGAGQVDDALEGRACLVGRKRRQAFVRRAVGSLDDSLQVVLAGLRGRVRYRIRCLGKRGVELVLHIELDRRDGLRPQPGVDGNRERLVDRSAQRLRLHVDRCLFLHAREGALGLIGLVAGHILPQPRHCGTVLAVADNARVALRALFLLARPGLAVDVAPEGDASTVVLLPHIGNLLLIALSLQVVVVGTDVILRRVHRHLQSILNLVHRRLEIIDAHIGQVMALAAVGIDGRASITDGADEVDKLRLLPAERVEVIIDEDGVRPTLVGHLEGLDNPVVARLALAAQGSAVRGGRMAGDGFVHHVDDFQVGIVLLDGVEILDDFGILFARREIVHPSRVLSAPYQRVVLEDEPMLLGIIG